jgi:hypothetical protein
MAIKKFVAVYLGVIYDSQPTNRKLGGLPARTPTPSVALQLVPWESFMTTSRLEYIKNATRNRWMLVLFD